MSAARQRFGASVDQSSTTRPPPPPPSIVHADRRRLSVATTTDARSLVSTMAGVNDNGSQIDETHMPLVAVLSEDNKSNTTNSGTNVGIVAGKLKLEQGSSKATSQKEDPTMAASVRHKDEMEQKHNNTSSNFHETKCDKRKEDNKTTTNIKQQQQQHESAQFAPTRNSQQTMKEGEQLTSPAEQLQHNNRSKKINAINTNNQNDNDDDNQVVPSWPSRFEAANLEPLTIQHQVYSLKDYSQVSAPNEHQMGSGRLLKSMSQDRKVETRSKRMSECITLSSGQTTLQSTSQPVEVASKQAQARHRIPPTMTSAKVMSSMGPATSVNSLLPPSSSSSSGIVGNKSGLSGGETRLDRMRKLFVSPLSLRGSSSGTSGSGPTTSAPKAHKTPSVNPRLSLQAGANMLNKPHYLMHAMYRSRAGARHGQRRSPMRNNSKNQQATSGSNKGFRVYGCPLSMANTMYPITCFGRADIYKQQTIAVPYILTRLCNYIEENSSQLTHEGIFRVSGNARLMEKLRTLFDHLGDAPLESESVDVATSASMLKMYLRELPEPLIPTRMNYYFFTLAKKYATLLTKINPATSLRGPSCMFSDATLLLRSSTTTPQAAAQITTTTTTTTTATTTTATTSTSNTTSSVGDTGDILIPPPPSHSGQQTETSSTLSSDLNQNSLDRQRLAFLRDLTKLIRKLPIENYNLLKYLACFLHRISLKQNSNKMSAEALGIVFGPNVFRIRSESYKGLKEQELSNQIMASVITSYRQLFDCELTDPLGNLINSEPHFAIPTETSTVATTTSCTTLVAERNTNRNSEELIMREKIDTNAAKSTSSILLDNNSPLNTTTDVHDSSQEASCAPSTSASVGNTTKPWVRCPVHGLEYDKRYLYNPSDEDDGDDDDERAGAEDYLDDDESGGDESYSPTSGSGSYCSSLASDSVDSIYEGDAEGEQYDDDEDVDDDDDDEVDEQNGRDDDDDDDDDFAAGTSSSSQCAGSETSYTPSSSHSELDAAELSTSNFSSSPNGTLGDDQLIDSKGANAQQQQSVLQQSVGNKQVAKSSRPCQVCKRRESAQIEAAKLVREQLKDDAPTQEEVVGKEEEEEVKEVGEGGSTVGQINKVQLQVDGGAVSRTRQMSSTRRRRSAKNGHSKASDEIEVSVPRGSSEQKSAESRPVEEQKTNSSHSNRHNSLTRRSSSASSLLQPNASLKSGAAELRDKCEVSLQANDYQHTRTSGSQPSTNARATNRSYQQHNQRHHHQRSRAHSDRRKTPRQTDKKSKGIKGNDQVRNKSSLTQPSAWPGDNHFMPELLAMDLSPETRRNLIWNYVSSSSPECERYLHMRSYNSDETLLRSQACCDSVSVAAETTPKKCLINNGRRRMSGQEYSSHAKQYDDIIASKFSQIYEAYEALEDENVQIPGDEENEKNVSRAYNQFVSSDLNPVKSSVISLLGDQLTNFKHSTLSINEEATDPIIAQLCVARDIIRALRKLTKLSIETHINKIRPELVEHLMTKSLIGSSNLEADDFVTCFVDHLAGRSVIAMIEKSLEQQLEEGNQKTGASDIQAILAEAIHQKISHFKRRYNNLKYIREHFYKYHTSQTSMTSNKRTLNNLTSDDEATDELNLTSADRLSLTSLDLETISNNSTLHTPTSSTSRPTNNSNERNCNYDACNYGSLCPIEFVFNIEKQLASRRVSGQRSIKLTEMSLIQLQNEKLELQKNLLRYEHWFGRPISRSEFNLVGHLYERYRTVKLMKQKRQASS